MCKLHFFLFSCPTIPHHTTPNAIYLVLPESDLLLLMFLVIERCWLQDCAGKKTYQNDLPYANCTLSSPSNRVMMCFMEKGFCKKDLLCYQLCYQRFLNSYLADCVESNLHAGMSKQADFCKPSPQHHSYIFFNLLEINLCMCKHAHTLSKAHAASHTKDCQRLLCASQDVHV